VADPGLDRLRVSGGPIDVDSALARLGGRGPLLWRTLGDFARDFDGVTQRLHGFVDSGELAEARRLAHTIKGLAGMISASALQAAALELETALTAGGSGAFEACTPTFERENQRVICAIHAALALAPSEGEVGAPPAVAAECRPWREQLGALREALGKRSFAARAAAQDLHDSLGSDAPPELTQLEQALDRFDFMTAHKALARVGESLEERERS
jgi:hypothetical protein